MINYSIITPESRVQLLKAIRTTRNFRFGAGFTDLIPEIRKNEPEGLTVINLGRISDKAFTDIEYKKSSVRFGALVTAETLDESRKINSLFPCLSEAARNLASSQIRHVATTGGNICTASPSGDVACALMALQAECDILSASGKSRKIPLRDFFKGPRKTALEKKEILRSLTVPTNPSGSVLHSGFIKVGTRRSMECSVVSLSWHICTDRKGKIISAGVAFGAAAPVIVFADEACNFIKGKIFNKITSSEKEQFAELVVKRSSPISDLRASAWYRTQVLRNISTAIFG